MKANLGRGQRECIKVKVHRVWYNKKNNDEIPEKIQECNKKKTGDGEHRLTEYRRVMVRWGSVEMEKKR